MNEIILHESKELREKYYSIKHSSGLEIYVIPKDFTTCYAVFSTKYGAVDNNFKTDSDKDFIKVPDGIAHFLEHKMFENEDGTDTFSKFAKFGADANAFTSTEMTAYLFSCTEHFGENLEILLDYVSKPYFTDENVKKEQGIIGQEINMGLDNPPRALYYNMLEAMYVRSQAKLNVAGSVESISHITPELLYSCYYTFYNFSNMMLCVSGNITLEEVLEKVDKILPQREQKRITRKYESEPTEINKRRVSAELSVSKPLFSIGIKDMNISDDGYERMKKSATGDLLFSLLFGDSSKFSVEVYESGLINGLRSGFDHSKICSFGIINGESDNPEAAYDKFVKYTEEKKKSGFTQEEFKRIKNASYASYIKAFDSKRLADSFMFYAHDGGNMFDVGKIISSITYDDVMKLFCELFDEKYYVMSVINPIKK